MKQQPSCSEDQYRVQGAAVSYHWSACPPPGWCRTAAGPASALLPQTSSCSFSESFLGMHHPLHDKGCQLPRGGSWHGGSRSGWQLVLMDFSSSLGIIGFFLQVTVIIALAHPHFMFSFPSNGQACQLTVPSEVTPTKHRCNSPPPDPTITQGPTPVTNLGFSILFIMVCFPDWSLEDMASPTPYPLIYELGDKTLASLKTHGSLKNFCIYHK